MRVPSGYFHLLRVCSLLILAYAWNPASSQTDDAAAYARGEALVRQHQWEQGLSLLEPLLKTTPANPRLLNLVGLAYTGKGNPKQADTFFEAALKASPGFVPALKNLGINEVGLGEFKAAGEHLRAVLRAAPDDPVVNLYLGESAYEQQDFAHAAQYLSHSGSRAAAIPAVGASLAVSYLKTGHKASALGLLDTLQTESLTARSQFALGVALADADLQARAVPYFESLYRTYPGASEVGYDLAVCELGAHQYPQAIATLEHLIAAGPETAEFDNLLAEAYEGNRQTQPAVDALRRAISLDPQDENNYLDFASLCINHQAFGDAGKVLEVGLSVHPKSAQLIFERGILNAMQDHFDQAEKDFEQSAALAPRDNSAYVGLGVTYIETGNTAQAVDLLRKRLAQQPNNASLSYLLGEALIRSGAQPGEPAFAEAQAAIEKSVRLDAMQSAPHAALGSIYLQTGKLQDAAGQLEQARRIDPRDKSAYSHLAVAYRRLGETDKAKEVLSKLQEINAQEREDPRQRMKTPDTGSVPSATPPTP